eukprot:scaffold29623_cov46-Attheya_sp.AAC.5
MGCSKQCSTKLYVPHLTSTDAEGSEGGVVPAMHPINFEWPKSQQMQSHLQVLLKKKHDSNKCFLPSMAPKSASSLNNPDAEGGGAWHRLKHLFCHQDSTSHL